MGILLQHIVMTLLLSATALLGAGDERPEWVKNRKDARFAETVYVQAVGEATKHQDADDNQLRAEAEDQARNAIAQQLQISIAAQSLSIKFESTSGDIVRDQSIEKIASSTNVTLSGMRIAEKYHDRKQKTYYALAVLDRRIAVRAMHSEILALLRGAEGALSSAKISADSGEVIQAILNTRRAYQLLQAADARRHLLAVLQTNAVSVDAIPASPTIEQALQVLNSATRTLRIETYLQSGVVQSRSELPLIIKAKVSADIRPLAKAAMTCSFLKGRGSASARGHTDDNGQTTIFVNELGPAPRGEYAFEVRLDTSELLLQNDQTPASAWNSALEQAMRPEFVSFKRLDLDLADYCAGAAADLAGRLERSAAPFQLALDNITYEETGAASPFVAYFKEQMASELALQPNLQLIAPEKIDLGLRNARSNYRGDKRPDSPEILADLVGANGILAGTYWDRSDQLEFKLRIIQRNSSAALATATVTFPKSLIPARLPYAPENFLSFAAAQRLDDSKVVDGGLKVDVWVDRGDGAIYKAGEKMTMFVRATQDSYLYLIYHDAGGNDVLIFPNARQVNNRILGGVIYQIPDARDSFEFNVQKPFGSELIKAVVAKEQLPELSGKLLPNGLKLLTVSYKNNLVRLRGITMKPQAKDYAEGSCVITTIE